MIRMIAAVSANGIIGVDGGIPWMGKYSSDMKRFKKLTTGGTVIMGKATWKSMAEKPLPNRKNYVIASKLYPENLAVAVSNSVETAIAASKYLDPDKNIWIIGGASIYNQAMSCVDSIDLTIIPEVIEVSRNQDVTRFPWINPCQFRLEESTPGEQGMLHLLYKKY